MENRASLPSNSAQAFILIAVIILHNYSGKRLNEIIQIL